MTTSPAGNEAETPSRRGAVWGWMAFDVAAQPFFTVVLTFVFGPYVVSTLAANPAAGQAAWGAAATVAGLLVALLSPVLGAVADRAGPRSPLSPRSPRSRSPRSFSFGGRRPACPSFPFSVSW